MDLKRTVLQTAAAAAAAALVLCGACHAAAPNDSAHSAVLVDAATGRVLYEKNADACSLIASTTKIMTALIICEQCDLQDIVTVPAEAVGVEGSSLALTAGEKLTVEALLYGMMLRSGNDAAAALAIYSAGSIPAFAEKMNRRAAELGLRGTHFENPHGLDADTHYSTARDLARLACAALKNADLRRIVGTKTITVGGRALTNHNKLLWRYPGATGVKTGYTKKPGACSSAARSGTAGRSFASPSATRTTGATTRRCSILRLQRTRRARCCGLESVLRACRCSAARRNMSGCAPRRPSRCRFRQGSARRCVCSHRSMRLHPSCRALPVTLTCW